MTTVKRIVAEIEEQIGLLNEAATTKILVPSSAPVTVGGRVIEAILGQKDRIDELRYGKVVVDVQDGMVVLLGVSEKYKPVPTHEQTAQLKGVGVGQWVMHCRCGWSTDVTTYLCAKDQMDAHISNSK